MMHWLEWVFFGGFVWLFVVYPFWSAARESLEPRPAAPSRLNYDLQWWLQESQNAESPFYRHVCEDMVAYLQDRGATKL